MFAFSAANQKVYDFSSVAGLLINWDSVLAIPARSDTVRTLQSEARSQGEALEGFAKTRVALAERMTPAQFAEAQRLAREWKPKTWDELKQGL